MADQILGNLVWKITGDGTDFDRNITASESKLSKFGTKASKIGKSLTKNLTLPIVGLGVVAIKLASDLEESGNAVGVVFEDATGIIEGFGETVSTTAGLAKADFNELATVIGAQLKQSGQDIDDVANNTVKLTQRAADLASVFNTSVKDATLALGSALRGEAEPARRFGVNISDAAVQAEALASGLVTSKKQINDQIKVQARYNIIMKQSADVAGDFENTSDGLANSSRILLAELKDLGADLGQVLLPIAKDVVNAIKDMVSGFGSLDEGTQKTIIVFAGIAAAAGPVISSIGKISKAMTFLAAHPVLAAITAVAALTAGTIALVKIARDKNLEEWADQFGDIAEESGVAAEDLNLFLESADVVSKSIAKFEHFPYGTLSEHVYELSKSMGLTEAEIAKAALTTDVLSESTRAALQEIIDISDRAKKQQAHYQALADATIAAAEAEKQKTAAVKEAIDLAAKQQIVDRKSALIAYEKELLQIQIQRNLGLISEEEQLALNLTAAEQHANALINAGYDGAEATYIGDRALRDMRDTIIALREELEALGEDAADTLSVADYEAALAQMLVTFKEERNEEIAHEAWVISEEERLAEEARKKREEEGKKETERIRKEVEERLNIAKSLYSNISTVIGSYYDFKKAQAGEDEDELKRIAKEEFAINKALQVANIGINTAAAIVGFLANPCGVAGVGLSIAAGVTGAVQAGLILATPPPAFANGVENFQVPPGYPNDSYPIMVQSGESVTVRTPEQQESTSSGGSNITINNTLSFSSNAEMERAARLLYPYIEKERERVG